jgi:alcohol dehydrogenase class IV
MPTAAFRAPGKFVFGAGSLATLGQEARVFGPRAVLVTGRRAMAEAGVTGRAMDALRAAGVDAALFDEVEPEPEAATVDRLREAARRHGADVLIGLGGGSAMDAAKAAAGLAKHDEPTAEFLAGREVERVGLPNIAVPSTSGTGSEMTNNAVVCDRAARIKTSIRHASMIPAVALADPEITVACPPRVTAMAGVDAYVQAVESYISRNATPLTEAVSLRAAEELLRALPAVVERGDDLALRTAAAWGSAMAGLALSNARLGVVHGIAHPVGVRYGVPHGLVCGVLLPAALEFNREAAGAKYAVLERLVGRDPAEHARGLLAACGLPSRLTEYGLARADFDAIAEESLPGGSTKANPRTVTKADVIALLEQVK